MFSYQLHSRSLIPVHVLKQRGRSKRHSNPHGDAERARWIRERLLRRSPGRESLLHYRPDYSADPDDGLAQQAQTQRRICRHLRRKIRVLRIMFALDQWMCY